MVEPAQRSGSRLKTFGIMDLTDTQHWNGIWQGRVVPQPLNPAERGLNATVDRQLHALFTSVFTQTEMTPGKTIIEAGCGGSVILPYFARDFGLRVTGLDNSETGCDLSRAIMAQAQLPGDIRLADIFQPPAELLSGFDMVFSNGLAEHFVPTTRIIAALAALAKPGGHVLTLIPNMHGLPGLLQRLCNPAVYRMHVAMTPAEIAKAHSDCGLNVVAQRFVIHANLSVVNFEGADSRVPARLGLRLTSWISKLLWLLHGAGMPLRPNVMTSPYVMVLARKGSAAM